jgi:hypothetical protein
MGVAAPATNGLFCLRRSPVRPAGNPADMFDEFRNTVSQNTHFGSRLVILWKFTDGIKQL